MVETAASPARHFFAAEARFAGACAGAAVARFPVFFLLPSAAAAEAGAFVPPCLRWAMLARRASIRPITSAPCRGSLRSSLTVIFLPAIFLSIAAKIRSFSSSL